MFLVSAVWKLLKYLLIIIIILLLSIILLFIFFPGTIVFKQLAQYALLIYGINNPHADVKVITSNQVVIENIDLGDPQKFRIKKIDIDYSINSLLSKKIDKLYITDLEVQIIADSKNHNKLSFGELDKIIYHIVNKFISYIFPKFTVTDFNINKSDIVLFKDKQEIKIPFILQSDKTIDTSDSSDKQKKYIYKTKFDFTDADVNLTNFVIPQIGIITLKSKLSGNLPFTINNRKFKFRDGKVFSNQSGSISFKPYNMPADPDPQTLMLYNLFSDFQYKDLNANIRMDESDIIWFNFSFIGSNKAFYNGASVNLKVNMKIDERDLIKYIRMILNSSPGEMNKLYSEIK